MTTPSDLTPRVTLLPVGSAARGAAAIAAAFDDDPVMNWLFEPAPDRSAAIRRFFDLAVGGALRRGHTYAIGTALNEPRGVALWLPPGVTSTFDEQPDAIVEFATDYVGGDVFDRLGTVSELMEAHHPAEPAFYLNLVGIDPAHQGGGLGARLLQSVIDRCDHDGLPAYLESSNPRNVAFYERLGFEIISEFGPTEGVDMAGMWRAPLSR